jgi:hypothetical protein
MEPQPIIGQNLRDMQASVECSGLDPRTLDMGRNMLLYFVYGYLPLGLFHLSPPMPLCPSLPYCGSLTV